MSSFTRRGINLKWIITWVLVGVLAIAMIFAFVKIDKNEKTKTLGSNGFTYSIGLLDESGEYEQGTTSIYTKDFQTVDGLIIDVKDNATVSYKVFFYDENKEFIEMSSDLSSDYDSSLTPENAEYFKVMITPSNDPEVSIFEIDDYAGQLTITVNK